MRKYGVSDNVRNVLGELDGESAKIPAPVMIKITNGGFGINYGERPLDHTPNVVMVGDPSVLKEVNLVFVVNSPANDLSIVSLTFGYI